MKQVKRLATLIVAVALAVIMMTASVALADGDATADNFDMYVTVNADGSMTFEEHIMYTATDKINGFTRDVDPSFGSGCSDLEAAQVVDGVEQPLTYDTTAQKGDQGVYYGENMSNGLIRYYMFVPCSDGDTVDMVYRYTLYGVCKRYSDVGVIDMPLLGDAWEMEISNYAAHIGFAADFSGDIDVLIKREGMDIDTCDIKDDGVIEIAGHDAGEGNVFSVRIMFPSEALCDMSYTAETDMHDTILAQEEAQENRINTIFAICASVLVAALVISIIIGIMTYVLWGKSPKPQINEYTAGSALPLRDDVGPAEVNALIAGGTPASGTIAAVMLDLARRGYIYVMGTDKKDMEYVRTDKPMDDCSEQEKFVMNWLMGLGDGERVSLEEIEDVSGKRSYSEECKKWSAIVENDVKTRDWFMPRPLAQKLVGIVMIVLAAVSLICGIVLLCMDDAYSASSAMLLCAASPLIIIGAYACCAKKRTEEGARINDEWKSVQKWIRSKWEASDVPADAELWEQLMVYALALDCSNKLAKRLDKLDPEYCNAMRASGKAVVSRWWGDDGFDFLLYSHYCSCTHSIMSRGDSAGSSGGSGAGGGGGGGTF